MRSSRPALVLRYAILSVLALLFLLPFYIIVRNAFSTQRWITSPTWHWLPDAFGWGNVDKVLNNPQIPLLRSLLNSALTAGLQTVGTVLISMMAGYALARWQTRSARLMTWATLLTLMVPAAVTFIPTFVMASSLGWISTYRGLIVPVLFSAFATYMFRSHFLNFPRELEEAAFIDGANPWTMFWRIVAPNSLGMVAAVGTITFIGAWNAFLWPLLIGQDDATRTVQVTLSRYMTSQGIKYPEVFMGALISVLPVLVVFLFLQRWLVQGVESSGIK